MCTSFLFSARASDWNLNPFVLVNFEAFAFGVMELCLDCLHKLRNLYKHPPFIWLVAKKRHENILEGYIDETETISSSSCSVSPQNENCFSTWYLQQDEMST